MGSSFIADYPEVVSIIVIVLGFVLANLLASGFEYLAQLTERGVRRLSVQRAEQLAGVIPGRLAKRVIYYATLTFFLLLAIRILGIEQLSGWLDAVMSYIPQIVLGGLIILVGYLLGVLTHSFVSGLLLATHGPLIPRLAQAAVVITAVMTGLAQMAVDVTFISYVLVILLATTLGGLALSFALGSRDLVANLLSRRNLTRYRVGDTIRVGDIEGAILEFTDTGVVLETGEGTVSIPAVRFIQTEVTLLTR